MSDLKKHYDEVIRPKLLKELGMKSPMQVPALTKITLNMGLGEAVGDKKVIASAIEDLSAIAGQKAVPTIARKSEAGFKIREGWPIGAKVTLRGSRMYDFFERLVSIAIPRIRDFRGFKPNAFDGQGNYSLGIQEQIVFPEIDYDKIDKIRGLDIAITTSAKTDEEGFALLMAFGFPLKVKKSDDRRAA